MTTVSVVIPTYDRSETLSRAIDSVFEQSVEDLEIVIVDDGSTDDTRETVTEYDDDRIRYLRHETNQGQNVARNTGLNAVNGTYVSYLDSDDEFLSDYLGRTIELLDVLPEKYGGVITAYEDHRDGNVETHEVYEGEISYEDVLRDMYRYVGGLSTVTFRSGILDEVGLHDEDVIKSTDLDFYLQLLGEYHLFGINEVLCRRFKREDSVSLDAKTVIHGEAVILRKYGDDLTRYGRSRRKYNRAIAYAETGEMKRAVREFVSCIADYPFRKSYYYHLLLALLGRRTFEKHSLQPESFHS